VRGILTPEILMLKENKSQIKTKQNQKEKRKKKRTAQVLLEEMTARSLILHYGLFGVLHEKVLNC
jgi:hypothetical protein